MAIRTVICDMLDIEHPLLLAGMGMVSVPPVVAAVSNAGGLGVLGGTDYTPAKLREAIREIRALTSRPFGVDLLVSRPTPEIEEHGREVAAKTGRARADWTTVQDQVAVCLDEQVPVIATGLGSPEWFIDDAHRLGIKVISLVGTVRAARQLADVGVDALVAQGTEAGGHTGRIATLVLVPQVLDAVKIPVVAAGGIGDGRGIAAALALGAVGVWMGTRFVASREAHGDLKYKERIVTASSEDAIVSKAYTGKPCRTLRNQFTDEWDRRAEELLPFPRQYLHSYKDFRVAIDDGNTERGFMPAGQISGLIRDIKPAGEIVAEVLGQAEDILRNRLPALIR